MSDPDPYFVPTRSSSGKNIDHDVVTFCDIKVKSLESKKKERTNQRLTEEIDMKRARFEVYKFAQNALQGEEKQQSKIQLAIKLGAKPPKNKYKNYKILKDDLKKELEEAEKKKELYNIPIKQRISAHKSKLNKGALRNKRKIGSGLLNPYGEVTMKKRKK